MAGKNNDNVIISQNMNLMWSDDLPNQKNIYWKLYSTRGVER